MSTVLFRADASPAIGTGHAMRCLALAQALRERGGQSIFLSSVLAEGIARRLQEEGFELRHLDAAAYGDEDARETACTARDASASWVVVDGYSFDAPYQDQLVEEGTKVLFLDDYGHCDRYSAHIVLNQNVSANEEWYTKRATRTRLLMGTRFVLLRHEFLDFAKRKRSMPEVARNVLVTLGGGDPDNVTGKVLRALGLCEAPNLRVTVLIGGSNPHRSTLEETIAALPVPVSPLFNARNVPELMAQADVAVCAGGTTSYEVAFMGVPALCIVIANNQREIAQGMDDAGTMQSLGWHANVPERRIAAALDRLLGDAAMRTAMSTKGQALVDGEGTERIIEAMHL